MEQRLHGIKVVIVEDVQWIIHELVAFLKQQGCVVYECSCEEQVAGIVSFDPDVVLMDGALGKGFTVWYGSELAEKLGLDKKKIIGISVTNDYNSSFFAARWTEKLNKLCYGDMIITIAKIVHR